MTAGTVTDSHAISRDQERAVSLGRRICRREAECQEDFEHDLTNDRNPWVFRSDGVFGNHRVEVWESTENANAVQIFEITGPVGLRGLINLHQCVYSWYICMGSCKRTSHRGFS